VELNLRILTIEIKIRPLLLQNSDEFIGKIRLRQHQYQVRHCNARNILLESPTASGKTMGFLLRAIENYDNTIVLYPTNALMWDQARSMASIIRLLGFSCAVAVEEVNGKIRWQEDSNITQEDIGLYVINSETLGVLADKNRSSEGKALLNELRRGPYRRIFLTNPEILYLVSTLKFGQAPKLLDEFLLRSSSGNLLVIDEFHLYHGYSLAVISYLLYMLRKIFSQRIFSSATPIDLERILLEEVYKIKSSMGNDVIVRHETDMSINSYDDYPVLKKDSVQYLYELIQNMYNSHKLSKPEVKVLVILNSVVTVDFVSSFLEQYFPGEVVPIHGLIPRTSRSKLGPIVVGTSAIEVGIDFDASSIIFEARDSVSFIQRLGRGGRHQPCEAICLVPKIYIPSLKKNITTNIADSYSYNELTDLVNMVLPLPKPYLEFIWSFQGAQIFFAILLSMNQYLIERGLRMKRLNEGPKYMRQLKDQILAGRIDCPKPIYDYLIDIAKNIESSINALSKTMSVRSSLQSIPAYFSKYNTFVTVSLQDIYRLNFNVMNLNDIEKKVSTIPYKIQKYREILWIDGIRNGDQVLPKIAFDPYDFSKPRTLIHEENERENNFDIVDVSDVILRKNIIRLIKFQPACTLPFKADWRFTGLYGNNFKHFLCIGGDAFLADFLKKND
jgi:CRISPR-associated helicase Cas3